MDLIRIEPVVIALFRSGMSPCPMRHLNIGAGQGTSITRLAESLLLQTNSKVSVRYEPRRNLEVRSLVADITRTRMRPGFEPSGDRCLTLQDVVDYMRVAV